TTLHPEPAPAAYVRFAARSSQSARDDALHAPQNTSAHGPHREINYATRSALTVAPDLRDQSPASAAFPCRHCCASTPSQVAEASRGCDLHLQASQCRARCPGSSAMNI